MFELAVFALGLTNHTRNVGFEMITAAGSRSLMPAKKLFKMSPDLKYVL